MTAQLDDATAPVDCCAPVLASALNEDDAQHLAGMFKALADPARVRLLSLIATTPEGEACICDLIQPVGLSQPTVSHHMKKLTDAGLVAREQRGKWAYYRVLDGAMHALAGAITPGR